MLSSQLPTSIQSMYDKHTVVKLHTHTSSRRHPCKTQSYIHTPQKKPSRTKLAGTWKKHTYTHKKTHLFLLSLKAQNGNGEGEEGFIKTEKRWCGGGVWGGAIHSGVIGRVRIQDFWFAGTFSIMHMHPSYQKKKKREKRKMISPLFFSFNFSRSKTYF